MKKIYSKSYKIICLTMAALFILSSCFFIGKANGYKQLIEKKENLLTAEIIKGSNSNDLNNLSSDFDYNTEIDLLKIKRALSGRPLREAEIFLNDLPYVEKIKLGRWSFLKRKVPDDINKIDLSLHFE